MCLLGHRLLSELAGNCTKEYGGELWNIYCKLPNDTVAMDIEDCDPYFQKHNVSEKYAIVGLASGEFTSKFVILT